MAKNKRKCKLIIDSCCDLPRNIVELLDVELIEFPYLLDGEEFQDDLGKTLSYKEFYERMRKGAAPSTAAVPQGVFMDVFTRALESGVPTVYLAFTSGLSSSFETAVRIADELRPQYPDGELYIVDSLLASVAEGLLVLAACHQRDRGLTASELVAWAEEARYYVHGYFTLDDLEPLRRGGRIPDAAAYAGSKLDIKPLLTFDLDGQLTFHSVARGRKKSLKALSTLFDERAEDVGQTSIITAHADAPKDVRVVEEHVCKEPEALAMHVPCEIGPVIGSHVGPGMVAVVFFGDDRRGDLSVTDRIANMVTKSKTANAVKGIFGKGDDTTEDKAAE